MPEGAAQSYELPMIEQSVADALMDRLVLSHQLEQELREHILRFRSEHHQIADPAYAAGQQEQVDALERILDKYTPLEVKDSE